MDRSTSIKLIGKTYEKDSFGQLIPTETERSVFGNLRAATRAEWAAAGQRGHNPSFEIDLFFGDYHGEEVLILNSVRYTIYRTYQQRSDIMTLYIEREAGNDY